MYKGEGTPRGYEYPVPESRPGSSTAQPAVERELPRSTLDRLLESARKELAKTSHK